MVQHKHNMVKDKIIFRIPGNRFGKKCSIIYRKTKEEPCVWILLLLCLYVLVAYYVDSIKIPSSLTSKSAQQINNIAVTFSYSYITGVIVFIFTVFIPNVRKTKAVLVNAAEDLRYLKDEMYEFSQEICGCDWLDYNNVSVEQVLQAMDLKIIGKELFEISVEKTNFIKEKMRVFDSYLRSIIDYNPYFSVEEIRMLTEIRNSYSFNRIRHHFKINIPTYENKFNIRKLIGDLIETNQKIVDFYGRLEIYSSKDTG